MSPPPNARPLRLSAAGLTLLLAVVWTCPLVPAAAAQPAEATTTTATIARDGPDWRWPIDRPHPIARAYSAPPTPYGSGHRGIDIAAASGANVVAPADGVVHFAGMVAGRPVLSIAHDGGLLASFEPVTTTLNAGDAVRAGDIVGQLAGPITHCTSPCLHFGVRLHGDYVSPLLLLGGVPHSVLLPTRR